MSKTGQPSMQMSPFWVPPLMREHSGVRGRFGPRSVREASTLFSFGHAGAYDHEDDAIYLPGSVRMIDMGDADIVHTDTMKSHANIEAGVRAALAGGALPVTIGGDHSINIPCINAFDDQGTFISCKSTPIWISWMNGMAYAMVTEPHAACSRKILCHGPDPSGHSKRKFDRERRI